MAFFLSVYVIIYTPAFVNGRIYMIFREATDQLCENLNHSNIAGALNASLQSIRQARLAPTVRAYRKPPEGWRNALIRLAEERVGYYRRFIDKLRSEKQQ